MDVSKQEALLALNRDIVARIASGEKEETRLTRKYPYGGMAPCKDGYVVIAVSENNHWQALAKRAATVANAALPPASKSPMCPPPVMGGRLKDSGPLWRR